MDVSKAAPLKPSVNGAFARHTFLIKRDVFIHSKLKIKTTQILVIRSKNASKHLL